jgi:hypothetical protein
MENQIVIANQSKEEQMIAELNESKLSYCSLHAETEQDKMVLFNAMNNPEFRLGDHINETILVKDVFCEIVDCVNEETGEVNQAPRIVLIDSEGNGYACVSLGIFSAIKKLMQVFGSPTWETPLPLKVVQVTKGTRKMLTLQVAK